MYYVDREYKDSNVKTEEVRLTWESSMYRCCRHLEELEHIRHEQVIEVFNKYSEVMLRLVTPLQEVRTLSKINYHLCPSSLVL